MGEDVADETAGMGEVTTGSRAAGGSSAPEPPQGGSRGSIAVAVFLLLAASILLVGWLILEAPVRENALASLVLIVLIVLLVGLALLVYRRDREARALRELVAAEKDRRRLEERYATLMREAREAIVLLDLDDRVVEANDYALALYGYARNDFVGQLVDVYRVPQGGVTVADRTAQLEAAGGHLEFESVHRRSGGAEFPVDVSLSLVEVEGERYFLQLNRDITERRAAEAALRDSEERYRTLFENSLSGFAVHEIVLDDEGRPVDYVFLAANPAFEKQSGLSAAEVVGRSATEVVPGLQETGLVERYGRVALTGEPDRFETFVPSLQRHFDIQVVSPKPGQFATIFIDVTQRREAEEIITGFLSSSPVGLFIMDRDLRCVRVNEPVAAFNGVPVEEHLGRTVAEIIPDLAPQLEAVLHHVIDTGEARQGVEVTSEAATPAGAAQHLLVTFFPIANPDGLVEFVGGVMVDVTEAKEAEGALEQSREFLERVLGVTPDLIYIFDIVEQRNVFANREMLDVLGYAPEEILEMGDGVLARILHPDDRELMAEHHRRARDLGDGEVLEVEYRMRRAGGDWRILHGRDTAFARDDDGAVTQVIGTAQDVTEQRRAEAALHDASQRLEAIVTAAPVAIVALDRDRIVRLWNPAAAATFGWSAGEVVGRPAPFIPAGAGERAGELAQRVYEGEQFAGLDLPYLRKDGSLVATSTSLAALSGADGQTDGVLMLIEDVSESRAGALRVARLTRLYQVLSAVAEAIPRVRDPERLYEELCRIVVEQGGFVMAWVGAAGPDGRVVVLATAGNDSGYAEGLGIDLSDPSTAAGPTGVAFADGTTTAIIDIAADARMAPFLTAAEERGFRSSAAVPILVDGRPEAVLSLYSPEVGAFDDEELALLERLAADVAFATEAAGRERARRRAEEDLTELNADLERRVLERTAELEVVNAELEAFSYSVSHDLRAPLRALDGFSLALVEDYGDRLDGTAFDYLGRIRAASQRMARLIDDLLTLSRVTRREMSRESVDLSRMAREIAGELRESEPDREVEVTVAANMAVDGDAHLLDVALRNVMANAWKFTAREPAARIEIGSMDQGDEPVFYVRDNGAGFDPAYVDMLFTPFQRLHGYDEFAGTGIGLATVQRIVRRHGGRVWAEGQTGKGATVYFTLAPRVEGG